MASAGLLRAGPPGTGLLGTGLLGSRLLGRRPTGWLAAVAVLAALAAGAATTLGPLAAVGGVLLLAVAACVWRWPVIAAYVVIGLTPLTTGLAVNFLPLVRPNEALDLLVGGVLAVRGLVRLRAGALPRLRVGRVELAIVAMAVANSAIPLLWMTVRQEPITSDDLLYALVLWKMLGLYVLVRAAVSTDRQVQRCLWLSVAVACVVAVAALMQSLGLFGVPALLFDYYGKYSSVAQGLQGGRGSSTLGLPAATGDLMIFNLAIVTGLWLRYRRHPLLLAGAAGLCLAGALAAGEFSTAIGLAVGLVCIAVVTRTPRLLLVSVPVLGAGAILVWPVISQRLSGFHSASGLPVSWTGRLNNLHTYFWPKLFSDWNFLLGVRPAARVAVPSQLYGYVWIESGYTWLLWAGGIPLLLSFLFFAWVVAQRGWQAASRGSDARSVAGIAVFTAVIVITVLMIFDPHLTYRGSADEFFALIALAYLPEVRRDNGKLDQLGQRSRRPAAQAAGGPAARTAARQPRRA
jgi:hypothetical protein